MPSSLCFNSKFHRKDHPDGANKKTRKIVPIKTETILDLNYFVIPEMLKSEGYVTGHFGKWHMGPKGFYPEQSGFDVNIGGFEKGSPMGGYYSPYKNPKLNDGPKGEYLTDPETGAQLYKETGESGMT